VKNNPNPIKAGSNRCLKNNKRGYPDIKTIKKTNPKINITVDKLDCIIKEDIIIVGKIIYKKNVVNERTDSL